MSHPVGPYTDVVNSLLPQKYNKEDGFDEGKICQNILTVMESEIGNLSVDHHTAIMENKLLHFYSHPRQWLPPSANMANASQSELFLFTEEAFVKQLLTPLSSVLTGFPPNIILTIPGLMVRFQTLRFEQHLLHDANSLLHMLLSPEEKDPIFEFNILAQCGIKQARIDITSTHQALAGDPYSHFYTILPTLQNFYSIIRDKNNQHVGLRTYSNKIEYDKELDVRGVELAYNLKEGSGASRISMRMCMACP